MTTQSQRETARIYNFPPRGRFARGTERAAATVTGDQGTVPVVVVGSGWYHDEAIREERATKNH